MAIDYSLFAIPKGTPAALRKHRKGVQADAKLEAAYRDVDARDDGYCLVTGVLTAPFAADPKRRREHHHLAGRNVRPDWKYDPRRIITVSAFVHALLTSHALEVQGTDASRPLIFTWNRRLVPAGKEPFRLTSKRWSANR